MFHSLMVPLDGSTFGEHALPLAMSIARRAGATLRLAHVHQAITPPMVMGVSVPDTTEPALRDLELAYLETMTKRVAAAAPVAVSLALLEGDDVAEVLRHHAEALPADLLVMCTHGRGALGRFWLGSVTDELVRHCHIPVLLVRPHEAEPDLTVEPMLKHLLLPLDGTPLAEQMIEPAVELGRLMEARFTLLSVVKPVVRPNYLPEHAMVEGALAELLEEIEARQQVATQEAQAYLENVAARLRGRNLHVTTDVIVEEGPAVGILREAQARAADLVALETHGRRGLARMLLGSVADKVVRGGTVPVLVQRPQA
jgi:nucleotide-binding universal stress UspA family protein